MWCLVRCVVLSSLCGALFVVWCLVRCVVLSSLCGALFIMCVHMSVCILIKSTG